MVSRFGPFSENIVVTLSTEVSFNSTSLTCTISTLFIKSYGTPSLGTPRARVTTYLGEPSVDSLPLVEKYMFCICREVVTGDDVWCGRRVFSFHDKGGR